MKGDFSRITFDHLMNFQQVLLQQGRVILDADWNEQMAILVHLQRELACSLYGPYGVPVPRAKLEGNLYEKLTDLGLSPDQERHNKGGFYPKDDNTLVPGVYYVGGIPCYTDGDKWETPEDPSPCLLYLDVWEHVVSYHQHPALREIALGLDGPDTALRSQVIWRIKSLVLEEAHAGLIADADVTELHAAWEYIYRPLLGLGDPPRMLATLSTGEYSGPQNQLYRLEIHQVSNDGKASFKWSRENGTIAWPIRPSRDPDAIPEEFIDETVTTLLLGGTMRDDRCNLAQGDWVEIVDDDSTLSGTPRNLQRVLHLENTRSGWMLILEGKPETFGANPMVYRWDHKLGGENGAIPIQEDTDHELEDGIRVRFERNAHTQYRPGDYWLIPARAINRQIIWPGDPDQPEAIPPQGIKHQYAPLAYVDGDGGVKDLRCLFRFEGHAAENVEL